MHPDENLMCKDALHGWWPDDHETDAELDNEHYDEPDHEGHNFDFGEEGISITV